jgi:DNA repair photolyase
LRLPGAVAPLFRDWLEEVYPKRATRIMRYVQELHGGKDYGADWGKRMKGEGVYAAMIARRFALSCRREGLAAKRPELDCTAFRVPARPGDQLSLF